MECFSGEDSASNGEIVLAADQTCAAKIGRGSNTFKDGRKGDEGGNVGVGEAVLACCDRCLALRLKRGGQGLNVYLLVMSNVFEIVVVLVRC